MDKSDRYKLKKYIDNLRCGKNTGFIDFNKLNNISYVLKKNEYKIYYPYPDSEKVILYTDNIPKIDVIKIDSYYTLKHNEILGSLFGLNIDMEYVGDIIIDKDNYYKLRAMLDVSKISFVVCDLFDIYKYYDGKYSFINFSNICDYIDNLIPFYGFIKDTCIEHLSHDGGIIINYSWTRPYYNETNNMIASNIGAYQTGVHAYGYDSNADSDPITYYKSKS